MTKLLVFFALVLTIYIVETRHVHPRSIVRMEEEGNRSDANSNIDGISIVSTPFSFLFVDFVPEPKLLLVHMKYDDAVAEMNKIIYHFFYLHLFGPFFL